MDFAERLKYLRLNKGLTQAELSTSLPMRWGIKPQHLCLTLSSYYIYNDCANKFVSIGNSFVPRWELPTSFAFLYGNRYKIVLKSIQSEIVLKSVQDYPKLKVL